MVEDWLEVDEPLAVVVEPVAIPLVEEELEPDVDETELVDVAVLVEDESVPLAVVVPDELDPVTVVVDMLEDDVPVPVVVASDAVEVAVMVLVWL